jgi:hypothetical protein
MTQIILTPDQAKVFQLANEPVQVCDAQGHVFGTLPPAPSAEFIAEQKRRAASTGPWYSGQDVQSMFQFLETERSKHGELSESKLSELMDQFEAEHGSTK